MFQKNYLIAEKYRIVRRIGCGGMADVYLARDVRTGRKVAVKANRAAHGKDAEGPSVAKSKSLCIPEAVCCREAEILMSLNHPALPKVFDVVNCGGRTCIVMEYIEGKTLFDIVKKEGPQSEESVLSWTAQLCDILIYLHTRKPPVIYMDMKPQNIICTPDGTLRLVDFGIAYAKRADMRVYGTRGYAAPEQYKPGQISVRADIYSLGMTMYFLLTGIDPRRKDFEIVPVRRVSAGVSRKTQRIIKKCTEEDPLDRYGSARRLKAALCGRNLS